MSENPQSSLSPLERERTGRQLAAVPALRQPVIVAMTANAFREDQEACTEAGMNDFISKPIACDRFVSTLRRATARHSR